MKYRLLVVLLALLLPTLGAPPAWAQSADVTDTEAPRTVLGMRPSVGARVGGYGFRDITERGHLQWQSCRMNGVGLFVQGEGGGGLVLETSVDLYHATGATLQQDIDRTSVLLLGAVGVRLFRSFVVSPVVLIGGGAEWTDVEVFGVDGARVLPVGFVGAGGELTLGALALGMQVRSYLMGLPDYEAPDLYDHQAWEQEPEVRFEPQVAGQVLFTVRYAL